MVDSPRPEEGKLLSGKILVKLVHLMQLKESKSLRKELRKFYQQLIMSRIGIDFEAIKTLKANEERYRNLVEQAVDGIFLSDAEGHYLDVNSSGAAMLGYSRNELLERSIADVIVPEEVLRIDPEVKRFENGDVILSEWQFRRKDGSVFPGEVVGRQLPDGRLQAILRDISERRQNEKALLEQQAESRFLADLFRNSSQPVGIFHADGRVRLVNRSFEQLTGYREEKLIKSPSDKRPMEWKDSELDELAKLEQTELPAVFEKNIQRNDGVEFPVELKVYKARDYRTGSIYYYAYVTDISRRKLEERNRELADHRQIIEESLRFFVARQTAAAIAHELNQPLTAIVNYSEVATAILSMAQPDLEKLRHILKNSVRQAQRAGEVIRQLLSLLHKGETVKEQMDLSKIIREALDIVKTTGEQGDFIITMDVEEHLPPVLASHLQIEKVLVSILRNGIEAMRENDMTTGKVLITAGRYAGSGNMAIISVIDEGKGLNAENLQAVFESFYTSKPKGLGMGLAISRSLIEAHGGKLWAETGQGGRFHFTLPFSS